jgi:adenosylhomocysteine nucleosidase
MKNFIIATAIKPEFPFDNEFPVIYTGVGKVNATLSICNYLNKNPQTQLVINVGSAGGINHRKGSVIECGIFIDGQLSYPNYVEEHIVFQASKNTCLTFDNFVTETPNKHANCVDMEAFALAKTCQTMGVNFLCFKYISDIIGEKNQENKWLENYKDGKDLLKEIIKYTI